MTLSGPCHHGVHVALNCAMALQAYLTKAAPQIVAGNQLPGLLGVFQKLIASKAMDHEGYKLLDSMMEHVRLGGLQQYLPTVSCSMVHGQIASAQLLCLSYATNCLYVVGDACSVSFIIALKISHMDGLDIIYRWVALPDSLFLYCRYGS